jgi:hypothetical protein
VTLGHGLRCGMPCRADGATCGDVIGTRRYFYHKPVPATSWPFAKASLAAVNSNLSLLRTFDFHLRSRPFPRNQLATNKRITNRNQSMNHGRSLQILHKQFSRQPCNGATPHVTDARCHADADGAHVQGT